MTLAKNPPKLLRRQSMKLFRQFVEPSDRCGYSRTQQKNVEVESHRLLNVVAASETTSPALAMTGSDLTIASPVMPLGKEPRRMELLIELDLSLIEKQKSPRTQKLLMMINESRTPRKVAEL